MAARDLGELVHGFLCNLWDSFIVGVHSFTHLEVDVRVLCRAAQDRLVWVEGTRPVSADQVIVHESAELFIR